MHPGSPLGRPENLELQQLLLHFDGPAYVRRGRRVQEAFDQLHTRCREQREEWLELVRIRLGTLLALAGDWAALQSFLMDKDQLDLLRQLHARLQPQLRAPVERTKSARRLRFALAELIDSIEFFNERWQRFLEQVDLSAVNDERKGYNRYYLLEKECAMRNGNLARRGFTPLAPVTYLDLAAQFPLLLVPRVK